MQADALLENLEEYSTSHIELSNQLSKDKKMFLLKIKKTKKLHRIIFQNRILNLFRFKISIKSHYAKFHFMRKLKRTLFRLMFFIGHIYEVDICFGNSKEN